MKECVKLFEKWSTVDSKLVQTGGYIMWNVWTMRNKKVFENQSHYVEIVS